MAGALDPKLLAALAVQRQRMAEFEDLAKQQAPQDGAPPITVPGLSVGVPRQAPPMTVPGLTLGVPPQAAPMTIPGLNIPVPRTEYLAAALGTGGTMGPPDALQHFGEGSDAQKLPVVQPPKPVDMAMQKLMAEHGAKLQFLKMLMASDEGK